MKNQIFKPMLTSNEQPDLDKLNYPLLSSTKLDGCRMLSYQGRLVTRSLKPVQNKQIKEKFKPLRLYTVTSNIILDGEIYAEGIPFYMISSCFMTQDYTTKKSIKRWQELCETYEMDITREEVLDKLKFYTFDYVKNENYGECFDDRTVNVYRIAIKFPELIVPVQQVRVNSADEVRTMFEQVLDNGYEGLILKEPLGHYKYGRTTINENLSFKVKPYISIDAKIIAVKQATKVDPNAPKSTNELGYSKTSKKKADRILIPRAKTFTVLYNNNNNNEVDVAIGGTESERDEIWANKELYIGRCIEYKGLQVGMKDVPRHCNMIRFREDKDD